MEKMLYETLSPYLILVILEVLRYPHKPNNDSIDDAFPILVINSNFQPEKLSVM